MDHVAAVKKYAPKASDEVIGKIVNISASRCSTAIRRWWRRPIQPN